MDLYVDPQGSGSFETVQEAVDYAARLQIYSNGLTIHLRAGTYTDPILVNGPWWGAGDVVIEGEPGAALHTTGTSAVTVQNGGRLTVRNLKIKTTESGSALFARSGGKIYFAGVEFGPIGGNWMHLHARESAHIEAVGNYTISGGAWRHWSAIYGASIVVRGVTVTLRNTPHFADCFAAADHLGVVEGHSNTFIGSATGKRYIARRNGIMNVGGAGSNHLPGNVAGVQTLGGLYY